MLEQAIVVSVMIWPQSHADIFPNIHHSMFNDQKLMVVFEAAYNVWKSGGIPEFVSVRSEIEHLEGHVPEWYVRKAFALDTVDLNMGVTAENAKSWVKMLLRHERFTQFKQGAAAARSIEDLVAVCSKALEPQGLVGAEDERSWEKVIENVLALQERISSGEITRGSSWGIQALDELLMLIPGRLYVVGGIKKGGKSHLLQHVAITNAIIGNPTLVFSLEMGDLDVARRIIAHETGVNSKLILSNKLSDDAHERIKEGASALATAPLTVNQQARVTPTEIGARIAVWKRRHKIEDGKGVVCVDFLQLMPLPEKRGQSEASALKENAYELARIAKDQQVAIVAAAQLRNEAEGQKPDMSFLEGSGGIAQAAEAIILLDLYSRRGAEGRGGDGFESVDLIVHQRNGESGRTAQVSVDLATSRFF